MQLRKRLAEVLSKRSFCKQQPVTNDLANKLRVSLQERSAQEILNGLQNFIYDAYLKGHCEQPDIVFAPATSSSMSHFEQPSDQQEIMIHAGSDDGITKADVLQFLSKSNILKAVTLEESALSKNVLLLWCRPVFQAHCLILSKGN